jgi:diguanylate cyclase (GGDEF)-like protein/PAS domain S-box-containing protein
MDSNQVIESILYVEDEHSAREELSEVLEDFCDTLYTAANGLEGLELFKKHHPKIVISDIKMPKLTGIEMAKQIYEIEPDAHVIFTTAFTDTEFLHEAISVHADNYILKPIDLDILVTELTKLIKNLNLKKDIEKTTQQIFTQKKELETILNTVVDGIAILNFQGQILYANPAYEKMLGYSLQELQKLNIQKSNFLKNYEEFQKVFSLVKEKNYIEHFTNECRTKNNHDIVVDMSLALMPDKERVLISTKDITKETQTKRKVQEYLEIIDKNVITVTTDLEGKIIYASTKFCEISEYSEDELIGKTFAVIRDPRQSIDLYEKLWENIQAGKIWQGKLRNLTKSKEYFWVDVKIYPTYDENSIRTGYTAIYKDLTTLQKLSEIAVKDALTDIYNRRYFNEFYPKYLQAAQRNNELVCFAMFDIDFFKQYNDTYGHQAGDEALIKVAKTIRAKLHRGTDYLFRLGGEEFAILFKATSKEHAQKFANELLLALSAQKIPHKNSSVSPYLSISMGLLCREATKILDESMLYKEVDDLLYQAKENGRNKAIFGD